MHTLTCVWLSVWPCVCADEPKIDGKKIPGIVLDDKQAAKTGAWERSREHRPFLADGYVHDGGRGKGQAKLRFTPDLPKAGRYRVYLIYPPKAATSTKTFIVLHGPAGDTHVTFDQKNPKTAGPIQKLGVFRFDAGKSNWVEIRTGGADGVVALDAIAFEPASPPPSKSDPR
jgi:hypothetical protein